MREGGSEQNYTATTRETLPLQPELFNLSFDEGPGGARPDRLVAVRPQEWILRHTVEQIGDISLVVTRSWCI